MKDCLVSPAPTIVIVAGRRVGGNVSRTRINVGWREQLRVQLYEVFQDMLFIVSVTEKVFTQSVAEMCVDALGTTNSGECHERHD